jgi:endonuclease/exonuclease/phosphatase family metal-dependent hydrolase
MNEGNSVKLFRAESYSSQARGVFCILSHNVFWFQGAPFLPETPPDPRPEILAQLCSLYREIAPDVLCLQELQSPETAETVATELCMKYIFHAGGRHTQYGGAVFSRWPMEEIALPQGEVPDRILIQARVFLADAPPLCVVNTHLPSGRQRGDVNAQKQRLHELSLVLQHADLLLGDFNESPDGPCSGLLQREHFVDAALACFAGRTPSNIAGHRGDHVWLSAQAAPGLQSYFVAPKERLALDDQGKVFLSDHLPLGCYLSCAKCSQE